MVTSGVSDGELIEASRGDPARFVVLFDRHFDVIHRCLRRRVGSDLAEDLTAQTFEEAFAHRERFDRNRADARPWLFGIAFNLLRHHYRHEERRLRAFARTATDPPTEEVNPVSDGGLSTKVAEALAALSPGDRDVLLLFAWADLGYRDIAHALNLPPGTVRSRLNRARRRVRELLQADPSQSDGPTKEIING